MATEKKNERKHELKGIQLFEEYGQYYLKLKYILEDEHSVRELEIPKVELPFNAALYPYIYSKFSYGSENRYTLQSSYGEPLNIRPIKPLARNPVCYTETVIKEKHKEMTLAEIEKKLGYKIKIVAEE